MTAFLHCCVVFLQIVLLYLEILFANYLTDMSVDLSLSDVKSDYAFFLTLKLHIQDLKTGKDNKLEVTLKYPHYFPIMERCKVCHLHTSMSLLLHSSLVLLFFLALFVCHCSCRGSRIRGKKEETHVKDFCCGKSQTADEKKSVITKT